MKWKIARVVGVMTASLVMAVLAGGAASARPAQILLDGRFGDWDSETPIYTDTAGDGGSSGIDLGRLWAADDPEFFYIHFETGSEILLNSGHKLTLYLDTDVNSATGISVGGIGAELEWRFGDKAGRYKYGTVISTIDQFDILFCGMPAVTAAVFEASFRRDSRPDGTHLLFSGSSVRILLVDTNTGGDQLPNSPETLSYLLDDGTLPPESGIALGKERATDLRIITNNVLSDGPWGSGKGVKFGRELAAIQPEIINFQEIYNHTPQQTADFVETYLPSDVGEDWYSAGNVDCRTVSRYPVIQSWPIYSGNLAVLLDTTPAIGKELLIVNVHLYCCEDDAGRQAEVDAILSFIRDAKTAGGTITLDLDTPILITGDTNFVGLSQQPTSLLTGDIVDNGTYGADFLPDWDGSDLTDLLSRQTSKRISYTWHNDAGAFWPGRLDYQIYTDSVLGVGNHFILYTPDMPADSLARYSLLASDSQVTDHLIVCADFRPVEPADTVEHELGRIPLRLGPNPAHHGGKISIDLAQEGLVRLEVIDLLGRVVAHPIGSEWIIMRPGPQAFAWDGRDDDDRILSSGTYFVRLDVRDRSGGFSRTEKLTLLR